MLLKGTISLDDCDSSEVSRVHVIIRRQQSSPCLPCVAPAFFPKSLHNEQSKPESFINRPTPPFRRAHRSTDPDGRLKKIFHTLTRRGVSVILSYIAVRHRF